MSSATVRTEGDFFPEPLTVERARGLLDDLMTDFRTGEWRPTTLESRVADMLLTSTAGDGLLTSRRIRVALWEGNLAMTHDNGGRLAQALADLVPVLDDPYCAAFDIIDQAGELVGAVAAHQTV
ncbi:hypothetical protein [Streptomyces sp. NBC_01216]|uniref:hypothetical protein n=1 Tax=unclassified Streptomyces TaxID=2593676 RepID=UPI002E1118FC|nr:hypothetical protein OG393_35400 [Streptomyces sp. NBC_01216]